MEQTAKYVLILMFSVPCCIYSQHCILQSYITVSIVYLCHAFWYSHTEMCIDTSIQGLLLLTKMYGDMFNTLCDIYSSGILAMWNKKFK